VYGHHGTVTMCIDGCNVEHPQA
jgi:hypothetical protein